MLNLSDHIEEYIKKLLSMTAAQHVEIQRNELADKFCCAPSQINYVLSTRFTPERGYLVQSRRGGRGYIRVMRIEPSRQNFWQQFQENLEEDSDKREESCSQDLKKIKGFIQRLYEDRVITRREAEIMASVMEEDLLETSQLEVQKRREIYKSMINHMLRAVLREM